MLDLAPSHPHLEPLIHTLSPMSEQEPGTDATEPSGADPHATSGPASSWSAVLAFIEESAAAADASLHQPRRNRNSPVVAHVRESTASLRAALREARRCPLPDDPHEPDTIDQTTEAHALTV